MKKRVALCISVLAMLFAHAQFPAERYPVIPKPQTLLGSGGNFAFNGSVTIVTEDKTARRECEFFRKQVQSLHNIRLQYGKRSGFEPCIFISLDSTNLPAEGYELYVMQNGINLYGSRAGVFYGLQTILQLIQPGTEPRSLIVPTCSVIDYPRFSWRGMHLDVARHFFPKENVKDYLRYMAMYKLNTFHWHLTDDQGWRIEIKKYPLLTQVGGWRNATLIGHYSESPDRYDSTRYGGFYTQDEIREVVRFADSLHITIVPEIEMPGHARALLAAYPALGSDPLAKQEVAGTWGVFPEVMCPKEETFRTLEGILDEVCALFPGRYIHIGGDECPKDEWKQSDYCQRLIREHQLGDEHGLQAWFVQRIVTYLDKKGKKAIGWDEILEGGLAEGAAVMSWRGEEGGIAAAKAHHHVVMTPVSHCYFDYYQSKNPTEPLAIGGYLPLEKVYSYEPVPAPLAAAEKKYIMGVQANLWTEYIPTFAQVQYMVFPRMAALSEVAWSRNSNKAYDNFLDRVLVHTGTYTKMGVQYSRAVYDIDASYAAATDGNGTLLTLKSIAPYGQMRYSFNSTVTANDPVYSVPLAINATRTVRAAVFRGDEKTGSEFVQHYTFHAAMGKNVTLRKPPAAAYNTGGAMTLTDGVTGRTPWTGSEWLGWWGDTLDATVDLRRNDTIHSVHVVALEDVGSWIYFPARVTVQFSVDGKQFFSPDAADFHPRDAAYGNQFKFYSGKGIVARYVRVIAQPLEKIAEGNSGAGYPAWVFVSEIIVE